MAPEALLDVVVSLFGPLFWTLRLPPIPAIPDVDRKLKELSTFGALKLMKNPVPRWQ
jgi:hypothetical protein